MKAEINANYFQKNIIVRNYLSKFNANNYYLRKTTAASMYTPIGTSYTKAEFDNRYSTSSSGGGLSSSGFTMAGDIDMSGHEVKGLGTPMLNTSAINKKYVDSSFLSLHGGVVVGNISMVVRA